MTIKPEDFNSDNENKTPSAEVKLKHHELMTFISKLSDKNPQVAYFFLLGACSDILSRLSPGDQIDAINTMEAALEPDRVDFIHAGFSCFILRNTLGNWCGYVGVPKEHSAYGKGYDDVPVNVHGGLTYADKCHSPICHVAASGMPEDVWWLGFDTAHSDDISPYKMSFRGFNGATYKNMEYVINETKQLAEQLSKL